MNGQEKSFKEKKLIMDDFIRRVNPYEKPEPLNIDLRGYFKYLEEHGIDKKEPNDIVEKFRI